MTKPLVSRSPSQENQTSKGQGAEEHPRSISAGMPVAALAIVAASVLVGLTFMRPNMGEPDSYREALSALKYLDEGVYSSYWDHPLTMYIFVAGTRLARATGFEQTSILNLLAVLFGAASVWPFFQLAARLANRKAAIFASIALILSPLFIEFSSYLSHEVIGFAFALWALYLFQRFLDGRRRSAALLFGLFFAATWCARPSVIFFISPPLFVLLLASGREKKDWLSLFKPALFAVLGLLVCLGAVYRPALIQHLRSYSSRFLFTYYEFGRYYRSTFLILQSALTPVLLGLALAGLVFLAVKRRFLIVFFAGSWMITTYVFYTGMYSMHRYFLILLPPALLLVFAAAGNIDAAILGEKVKHVHPAKAAALLLLIAVTLVPNLSDFFYYRSRNDDKAAATAVGEAVGRNLLFTTAPEPMILYYNRENPPETVYLVTEYSPGKVVIKMDALRLAQERLREGRPVFLTEEILPHLALAGVDAQYQMVFEFRFAQRKLNRSFRSLRLFRLTSLKFGNVPSYGSR